MNKTVEKALSKWGMEGAQYRLVAARENAVYEVTHVQARFALRLHRKGYRSDAELNAELAWMVALADGGLCVPAPVPSLEHRMLHHIDGTQVDVLTWLTGETMADVFGELNSKHRSRLFYRLGQDMALLHELSDAWSAPSDFERVHWNREGLLGEAPHWDRFWDNPRLNGADRKLFEKFRNEATARLARLEESLDYGLIHADLVPNNVLVDGHTLRFIDFDDGGFGFRLFDIATALHKHISAPDYPTLQNSLIEGYRTARMLDDTELSLFLALRAATYVGWNIERMDEPDGTERNARFINTLRCATTRFLYQ